jgi:hypothetical protein
MRGFSCARALKFISSILFFLRRKRAGFEIITRVPFQRLNKLTDYYGTLYERCVPGWHFDAVSIHTDCGVCKWPSNWFSTGKGERSLFVTSNRCIPVKNVFCWSRVVSCACDVIQLFAVAFRVIRAVKIDFRLVRNDNIKPTSCSEGYSYFDRTHTLSPSRRSEYYGTLNQAVLVNCTLMSDISTHSDCGVCSWPWQWFAQRHI